MLNYLKETKYIYKTNKLYAMYWRRIQIPIIDLLKILNAKIIYDSLAKNRVLKIGI
jgi:hypothetical protein